jgi:hypothetical protein
VFPQRLRGLPGLPAWAAILRSLSFVRSGEAEVAAGAGGLDLTDMVGGPLVRTGAAVRGMITVDSARAGYPGLVTMETGLNGIGRLS